MQVLTVSNGNKMNLKWHDLNRPLQQHVVVKALDTESAIEPHLNRQAKSTNVCFYQYICLCALMYRLQCNYKITFHHWQNFVESQSQ